MANYRGAAEKTFALTHPGEEFRNATDQSVGIILKFIFIFVHIHTYSVRKEQLKIDFPIRNQKDKSFPIYKDCNME